LKKIEVDCKVFLITDRKLEFLREKTIRVFPIESCAALFGTRDKKEIVVERIVMVPNISPKSQTKFFEADPEIFIRALMQAEGSGIKHIGFFHSHPARAVPSTIPNGDVECMKRWGDAVWLILSMIDYQFAAFQMINGEVHRLILKVVKKGGKK
jgi:proteasome lid subunit RPN8/RPN11